VLLRKKLLIPAFVLWAFSPFAAMAACVDDSGSGNDIACAANPSGCYFSAETCADCSTLNATDCAAFPSYCTVENDACIDIDSICVPMTCEDIEATCGTPTDGCGGSLSCGSCNAGESCGGSPLACSEDAPVCGDGSLGSGEQCDDDNTDADDGCSASCQTEAATGPLVDEDTIESILISGWQLAARLFGILIPYGLAFGVATALISLGFRGIMQLIAKK
jgi:cysteine-rich repeat protein